MLPKETDDKTTPLPNEADKSVSRRQFIKEAAVVAGGMAVAGGLAACATAPTPPPTPAAQAPVPTQAPVVVTATPVPQKWDKEADVVVVGAGAAGLPAAIEAAQAGASVLVIDANYDVGGQAIISGGGIGIGGGTSLQKKYGIVDSPDLFYADLTDWRYPEYRYNDRALNRAFADNGAPTFEWLIANGVVFVDRAPSSNAARSGTAEGMSAARYVSTAVMGNVLVTTGKGVDPTAQASTGNGVGLIRPLEASAKKLGAQIMLNTRMTRIIREPASGGNVLGIEATSEGKSMNIRAKKAVIVATGGHAGNVDFRRMFDPRLTEEYNGAVGEPFAIQDASGEIAAMSVGAALWGLANNIVEIGLHVVKAGRIGCQYSSPVWLTTSPVFPKVRASGLGVTDWQDVICVNQVGKRFWNELDGNHTSVTFSNPPSATQGQTTFPTNFINPALGDNGGGRDGGGPIWAIFDADAVKREKWDPAPPNVDIAAGYFFTANTIAELAAKIVNKYQLKPMPASALQETVTKYNSFVDTGTDSDFGKPTPKYKIATPPFYAAWATPALRDTRAGLRTNAKAQVIDLSGKVIPRLYCAGVSAGGSSSHGLARCIVFGRIAGKSAAAEATK